MELSQSKKSHDSDDFGVKFVDTSDSNNKGELRLSRYMNLTSELGLNYLLSTFLRASISARLAF